MSKFGLWVISTANSHKIVKETRKQLQHLTIWKQTNKKTHKSKENERMQRMFHESKGTQKAHQHQTNQKGMSCKEARCKVNREMQLHPQENWRNSIISKTVPKESRAYKLTGEVRVMKGKLPIYRINKQKQIYVCGSCFLNLVKMLKLFKVDDIH